MGKEEKKGMKRPKRSQKKKEEERERDAQLVKRVVDGDKEAFSALVELYQQKVLGLALGYLGTHEDLESVVQDVFLKAYRQLKTLSDPRQFGSWLLTIARNYCIDIKRKKKEDLQSLDYVQEKGIQVESRTPSPLHKLIQDEGKKMFWNAFSKLSEQYRELLILKSFLNLSYKEISDITGLSKQKIGELLFKARKELQKLIQKEQQSIDFE